MKACLLQFNASVHSYKLNSSYLSPLSHFSSHSSCFYFIIMSFFSARFQKWGKTVFDMMTQNSTHFSQTWFYSYLWPYKICNVCNKCMWCIPYFLYHVCYLWLSSLSSIVMYLGRFHRSCAIKRTIRNRRP